MTIAVDPREVSLRVSRQEFASLRGEFAQDARQPKRQGATLSYANGRLGIKSSGVRVTIAASGSWLGVVQVPLGFILTAMRIPPAQDPFPVMVRDNRLHIGDSSITCRWLRARAGRARELQDRDGKPTGADAGQ
jgi:hypothetical protein